MKLLKKVGTKGYPGMLVFAQIVRNIDYSESGEELYQYEDKLSAGFILDVSKKFDAYYEVKFFNGSKAFHWGVDLFCRKEE